MNRYFAHPEVFWLLPALSVVWLAVLWSRRQRRRAVERLGQTAAVHRLLAVKPGSRRLRGWCLFLGMALLFVGTAGPRWGWDFPRETSHGHDLVLVLDMSRSMFAEQPRRIDRAMRSLRDLADHLQKNGGPRLALVIFASRPHVVFPLTHDYSHFRKTLTDIEAGELAAYIRPDKDAPPASGTRLGAALDQAVHLFDPETKTPRAVLLFSDGDDPQRYDGEWLQGVHAARAARVPVHAVGIGDPHQDSSILVNAEFLQLDGWRKNADLKDTGLRLGDFLRHDGEIVKTRLEEDLLRQIAERTGGTYVPAHTSNLPLGSLLPKILSQQKDASPDDAPAGVPVLQPRQGWFLWPALGLLTMTLLIRGGKNAFRAATVRERPDGVSPLPNGRGSEMHGRRSVALRVGMVALLALLLGAALANDDWIRQGNAAVADGELELALAYYEKAEVRTTDPGLVAFNKAAVYYRLGRFREAELHYLRCLEDDPAPPARQAQALFGLGTSRLRQAKHIAALDRAIEAYMTCLALRNLSPELATDVQFNLEAARRERWRLLQLETPPAPPEDGNPSADPSKHKKKTKPDAVKDNNPPNTTDSLGKTDPEKSKPGDGAKEARKTKPTLADQLSSPGTLQVLPGAESMVPVPLEDTEAYLEEAIERIRNQRRADRRNPAELPSLKNW